jgi:hypothetical protein
MSRSIACWSAVLCSLLLADRLAAQETATHVMLGFDDKGKVESPGDWAKVKNQLASRKAAHVFIIAHGWRVSKGNADETVLALARLLREQRNGESIEVVGVRWPSLLGENESERDNGFKDLVTLVAKTLAKSESVKEKKEKLKAYLKKTSVRLVIANKLKVRLPDDETIDQLIDHADEPENIARLLTLLTYYEMKRLADTVGSNGLGPCLSELQARLPLARFHLVGHSFGCKAWLACLASEERADKQVDSLTLLQGAVSTLCFAPTIEELTDGPCGAYAGVPKRVKGCIVATHSKKDAALSVAYVAASQAAGQVGELPVKDRSLKLESYSALGGKGITAVPGALKFELGAKGKVYELQRGLNAVNGDNIIGSHSDIRRDEVAWLIWSAARQKP